MEHNTVPEQAALVYRAMSLVPLVTSVLGAGLTPRPTAARLGPHSGHRAQPRTDGATRAFLADLVHVHRGLENVYEQAPLDLIETAVRMG
jgi:hypothetical protein